MRKYRFLILALASLTVFALALVASAQGTSGSTLKSFSGTILEVDLTPPGIGCTLKTESGTVFVELGPVENFPFASGDSVTVTGEEVEDGRVIAYSVSGEKNGNTVTLELRDANGKPILRGTPGPKEGNRYENRNRVRLQDSGDEGNRYQSGPQDGTGNQWQGGGGRHQSGSRDGNGNQWGRR